MVKPATPVTLIIKLFPEIMKSTSHVIRAILSIGVSSGVPSKAPAAPVVLTVPMTVKPVEAGVEALKPMT